MMNKSLKSALILVMLLTLGITEQASKSTDVRIREYYEGAEDPHLEAPAGRWPGKSISGPACGLVIMPIRCSGI